MSDCVLSSPEASHCSDKSQTLPSHCSSTCLDILWALSAGSVPCSLCWTLVFGCSSNTSHFLSPGSARPSALPNTSVSQISYDWQHPRSQDFAQNHGFRTTPPGQPLSGERTSPSSPEIQDFSWFSHNTETADAHVSGFARVLRGFTEHFTVTAFVIPI